MSDQTVEEQITEGIKQIQIKKKNRKKKKNLNSQANTEVAQSATEDAIPIATELPTDNIPVTSTPPPKAVKPETPSKKSLLSNTLPQITPLLAFFEIPQSETWPVEKANKKLIEAMKISQFLEKNTFKTLATSLTPWPVSETTNPHFNQFQLKESMESLHNTIEFNHDPRKILLDLSRTLDHYHFQPANPVTTFVITDKKVFLTLVIQTIYKLFPQKLPFISLSYSAVQQKTDSSKTITMIATRLGILELIRYLELNASLTTLEFIPELQGYTKSFILPVKKLSPAEKQLLTQETACGVCGKENGNKCKQCMNIRY